MTMNDQLKKVRLRLGESQAVFALRFGVDQATVHRWESNGIPGRGTTQKTIERFLREFKQCDEAAQ